MSLDLLTDRQPRRETYPVHLDDERAQRRADLVARAQAAEPLLALTGSPDRLAVFRSELAAIDAEAEVLIHLVAVGVRRVEELMVAHPPTKDQTAAAKRLGRDAPMYNPDEVFPALLSEAIEKVEIHGVDEGRLTPAQVTKILESDGWPNDQIQDLCSIAMRLNNSPTARAVGNV